MDPTNHEAPANFELPSPLSGNETESPQKVESERAVSHAETASNAAATSSVALPPLQNPALYALPTPSSTTDSNAVATPQAATVADDVDLIEKEWVVRAKHIIEKTRDDPYQQNKQLYKEKANYIEKRWNKKIKQSDDNGK